MKKLILLLSFITISVLIFNSCSKECVTKDQGIIYLSASDKQVVPYTGNERLVFTDSLGNNKIYKNGKMENFFQTIYADYVEKGGCPRKSNKEERFYVFFEDSSDTNYSCITFMMYPSNQLINTVKNVYLNFTLHDGKKNWFFVQSVRFDDLKLFNLDTTYDKLSFNDSLKLVNKIFHSVYTWKQIKIAYHSDESLQYVYYTIKEGIVGFKSKDGHRWYLKN